MKFSQHDKITIDCAIYDASIYLDSAFFSLESFYLRYFESCDGVKDFVFDLQNNYDLVLGQLMCIRHMLLEAKLELDVFSNCDSPQLQHLFKSVEEKKQYISAEKIAG